MQRQIKAKLARSLRFHLSFVLILAFLGCSSFFLEDCPEGGVIGVDEPRIRSWRIRLLIKDRAAAAERFVDYAAMSAYAYSTPKNLDCGKKQKLTHNDEHKLLENLSKAGWERFLNVEYAPPCEDDVGLFYHVWKRETAKKIEVVIAFRGTWGFNDWRYGNSYWFRRFFTDKHQYEASRKYAKKVFQYIDSYNLSGKVLEFSSTGHSLGGGLAQAVFYEYANMKNFKQAYAFDPSSATAYTSRSDKSVFATCDSTRGFPEPRIFRIYESYEILSNLRIFHKLFFPPERWINEVRFNYSEDNPIAQHSMVRFALALLKEKLSTSSKIEGMPWYSSKDEECSDNFIESLNAACNAKQK
jgi:hypothetical protein